ncbi:DUF6748 domain-containing protein [Nostoc sp. C057]
MVRRDFRKCASPICGGIFYKASQLESYSLLRWCFSLRMLCVCN